MFWKVAGFSQPSPIDQIMDKDEYTLEELLDEDDVIQECKSLNGRLVAFLRERSTVEQLIRFLVDPPSDGDDPKRAYKYPFTSCEVFCCEVEAVFNTLLEDEELMQLLFSLLSQPAPLSSKTAGYFGRVVGTLLLRKTNEMMQYLQDKPAILAALVNHVGTTSIADIVKRIVGADDQASILFLPQYAQWLANTPLVDLLLARLAEPSSDAQTNAADILSGIAHTQPSPLASKLTNDSCIAQLFQHAMAPGNQVLVPALDVCIALVEPRRSVQSLSDAPLHEAVYNAKVEAVNAIVEHLPKLAEVLKTSEDSPAAVQETPCGLLAPRLGRARLRVVQLLAVLLRSECASAETAVIATDSVSTCLKLFAQYTFNNMLHSQVVGMLMAILNKASDAMLQHLFQTCKLLDWLTSLPVIVRPVPLPGQEEIAASKPLLRAGYMGHVTQIASTLDKLSSGQPTSSSSSDSPASESKAPFAQFLDAHSEWQTYLEQSLRPRQELENTSHWACGRPTATELNGLDSDNDEFQAEMELEHMGMQPALYHRYNVDEHDEDEEEEEDEEHDAFKTAYGAHMGNVTDAISNIDLSDINPWHGHQSAADDAEHLLGADGGEGQENAPGQAGDQGSGTASSSQQGLEDDAVLLATSDDDEAPANQGPSTSPARQSQLEQTAPEAQEPVIVLMPVPQGIGVPAEDATASTAATDLQGSDVYSDGTVQESLPQGSSASPPLPEGTSSQAAAGVAGAQHSDGSALEEAVPQGAEGSIQNTS
ncbi:SIT4 phosphatase-associated protein-domain-containing protein [Haematococcus lacustris]